MDAFVKRIQAQLPSIIVSGLALYFAVVFGLSGGTTLLLLHQGVTGDAAAALAQAVGYAFGPAFAKVTTVAAAMGATKIAIAGYFILAVTERSPAAIHGEVERDHGALDLALHGAAALTLFEAIPAWLAGDAVAGRMHMANVMLICVAIGTSMFDREAAARRATRVSHLAATSNYQPKPDRPLPTGRAPMR